MKHLNQLAFYFIIFLFNTAFLACTNSQEQDKKEAKSHTNSPLSSKINGLSFVSPPRKIEPHLVALPKQKVKANALSIMPYGFVGNESSELIFNADRQWWGERTKGCIELIEMAKNEGYKVLLKPQVWKRGGAYTGEHDYTSEQDWLDFEKSYSNFILHFAEVADSMQVDYFAIGTEWKNFVVKRPQFWRKLIQEVRATFKGKITYAANWDEYPQVSFWDELDYIGIDAYFPLLDAQTPEIEELKQAMLPFKQVLQAFSDSLQKQILFTEYGYRSRDNNTHQPWESDRGGTVNLLAQENAYHAFYQTFWQENFIAGGFIWKWFPNYEQSGGKNHTGFTPQNKPVEAVIRAYN